MKIVNDVKVGAKSGLRKGLRKWWFVAGLITILSIGLLCFGLPIFVPFMRPLWVRILCAVFVLAMLGLFLWLRVRKARKASGAIAAELSEPSASDVESQQQAQRMAEALSQLKTAGGKKQRDYLYTQPWYVIIGPPGAGKTTALVNSGLRFPYADQAFKGVGGTRNLDFMFADEAVLVDTAGRYTSQDSDQSVDSQGWRNFLALLKKHRPLQPINGVIVAIGLDELVRGDRQTIDQHAATVRRRLAELRRALEIKVPVYLLLTKADLLAGFVEYFEDLDVEGRRAVFGHTLPLLQAKPSADMLIQAFDEMTQRLTDRQAKRLNEEPDQQRRALIMGFPTQLQMLRSRLLRFMEGAFVAGDDPSGTLRGFYLTSGVQEGAPLDRIISGMADVYDQPQRQAPGASGRAYFLNRLLGEVMFPEAGLVTTDPAARKRQKAMLTGALAAIGVACFLTIVAWGVSFARNRSFQHEMVARAEATQAAEREAGIDLVEVRGSDADLEQSLEVLRELRNLPRGYAEQKASWAPISMRFGLYQSGLADHAEEAYHQGLRRILLPRILLDLEKSLQGDLASPLAVYEPLKVYLMLGGQGPMDPKGVRSWVTSHWATETYPGGDRQQLRDELGSHLDALLEDPDSAGVWRNRQAPLDGQLIAQARAVVSQMSMAERAYAIMRQKALASGAAPWTVAGTLSTGDAVAFADPNKLMAYQIPAFFTRTGYEKSYQLGLATVASDLQKDLWVMGGDASTASMREQMSGVRPGVAGLYAKEYIGQWEGLIAAAAPADYFHNPQALAAFTRAPSPLKVLLIELAKNVNFEGGTGAVKGIIKQRIKTRLEDMESVVPGGAGLDAATEIRSHFQDVEDYVSAPGNGAAPIDAFVEAVKTAGGAVTTAGLSGGGMGADAAQSGLAAAMAQVMQSAAGAPAQLQPFAAAIAKGGGTAQVGAAQGAVSDAYAQSVLPACKSVAQDRYPFFAASANDVTIVDAMRVFGLGGTIDQFTAARLVPLMDTSGPVWRWKDGDPIAATLDPATPDSFAKAQQLRDLLAGGITLKIEPASFGADIDGAEFQAGDQTYKFTAADKTAKQVRWTAQGGLPEASVTTEKGTTQVAKTDADGVWALFRLFDKARRENAGPTSFLATFGDGPQAVTFKVSLPTETNPFSRGGMWTFRCPITL